MGKNDWSSFDGKVMPWRSGNPVAKAKTKAVVITIHGLSGAASDFWMLEQDWPKLGIAVYGLQLRGQGNDPDLHLRGDIESSRTWKKDLRAFHDLVKEQYPDTPVFWYAESLGTLIALHTYADYLYGEKPGKQPAGIILSSPVAGLRYRPTGMKECLIHTAVLTVPWFKVNLEKLAHVDDTKIRVTHDTTFAQQMAITPHYVPKLSLRLLGQIDEMIMESRDVARKVDVPVLMLGSPNDVIATEEQVQQLYDTLASKDKTLEWYRQSYHLLLHDVEREKVMADVTGWVEQQIKDTKTLHKIPGRL
jgi:alpha-beta hydrolase superfamily lysophospholipase